MGDVAGIGGVVTADLVNATTWTGVPLGDIVKKASEPWPKKARTKIKGGPMQGKTDITFLYARERMEKIFGPHVLGWRLLADPILGKIHTSAERRTSKESREYTEWTVTLEGFVFQFAARLPDGAGIVWLSSGPM